MPAASSLPPCAYCGLPTLNCDSADAGEPAFCCYGCRLAAQIQGVGDDAPDQYLLVRLGIAVFFAMNVMAFTMALWTGDVYGSAEQHRLETPLLGAFRWITMLFSMPVYYLLGVPLAENCWTNLKRGVFSTDLLLLLGVAAAFAVSLPAIVHEQGPVYFEVGVAVLVFVTLGRWLEARCKWHATRTLDSLETLLPESVDCERDHVIEAKPLGDVQRGDLLVVRAGQRTPCDGVVERWPATLDEQLWTGESGGRIKQPGDEALAGCLNLSSDLYLRVASRPHEGSLLRLTELMRAARQSQGRYERLADRLSRILLPVVVAAALTTTVIHGMIFGVDRGVMAGLAVVLIACPCALGIATPLAVWAALGAAAQRGILFRSGEVIERVAGIRAIYFDKTGTLTEGTSTVTDCRIDDDGAAPPLAIACGLASASHHVLSRAIVTFTERACSPAISPPPVTTHVGRGLEAVWPFASGPETVRLGSCRFLKETGQLCSPAQQQWLDEALASGEAIAGLGWGGRVRVWFRFAESLRPEAAMAIRELQRNGIAVRVLTGDHQRRGDLLARALDVPVDSELMPADKWRLVQEGRRVVGPVAMVGDGINDAPALAGADVGIAMGCGADIARASAGVCLLGNDLTRIAFAVDLAKRTVKTIRLNLFWSFAYNIVGIGMACTGALNPAVAAAVMTVSSLFVVANSVRLASNSRIASAPSQLTPSIPAPEPALAAPLAEARFR